MTDHTPLIEFDEIVHDAEISNVISPVVRRHRLTGEEIEKALLERRIPRAANVAQISVGAKASFSPVDTGQPQHP